MLVNVGALCSGCPCGRPQSEWPLTIAYRPCKAQREIMSPLQIAEARQKIKKGSLINEPLVLFLLVNAVEIGFDVGINVDNASLAIDERLDVDRDDKAHQANGESHDKP